jgi:hypothetical protein
MIDKNYKNAKKKIKKYKNAPFFTLNSVKESLTRWKLCPNLDSA